MSGVRARGVAWAASSTGLTAGLGGLLARVQLGPAPHGDPVDRVGPVWGHWAWWVAAAVHLLVLLLSARRSEPTARRFVLASTGAGIGYIGLGSLLSTLDPIGSGPPAVAVGEWASAAQYTALFSLVVLGNGTLAVVAPLSLGLVRTFRPATLGQPPRWSQPTCSLADEDAAAEDFDIF